MKYVGKNLKIVFLPQSPSLIKSRNKTTHDISIMNNNHIYTVYMYVNIKHAHKHTEIN